MTITRRDQPRANAHMPIVGYADRLTVAPGEDVRVMVSTTSNAYRADLVAGATLSPSAHHENCELYAAGQESGYPYPGIHASLQLGSFALIPDPGTLLVLDTFTLEVWVYPTGAPGRRQCIMGSWLAEPGAGYGLFLEEEGDVALRIGDGVRQEMLRTKKPLARNRWHVVSCAFDSGSGKAIVLQSPPEERSHAQSVIRVEATWDGLRPVATDHNHFLLAASVAHEGGGGETPLIDDVFNGKIARPRVLSVVVDLERTSEQEKQYANAEGMWDLALGQSTNTIRDISGKERHGIVINMPMRAVTGPGWRGDITDYRHAGEEYDAIHFHNDDLADARWPVGCVIRVPDKAPSGPYAIRLQTSNGHEDLVPIWVTSRRGRPTARVALLASTFTDLAYGNHVHEFVRRPDRNATTLGQGDVSAELAATDLEALNLGLLSLYDVHSDGTGVCYSSRLRPLLTMRPDYRFPGVGAPHGFSADLVLWRWLKGHGYDIDCITDEDLHYGADELLAQYGVVVTGSHPEYWTRRMLDGLTGFVRDGGRLMYLGGNGFYWVTSVHPAAPHVIEVRRGSAGNWSSAPGEIHHAGTGEAGSLWRFRGCGPHGLVGIGYAGMGPGKARPYRRLPASFAEDVSFIFEGVSATDPIGDHGDALGGAAGWEIDRHDVRLGSPEEARVLATACDFDNTYEECLEDRSTLPPDGRARLRADMCYFRYPNGGAVFSVGSLCWTGALGRTDSAVDRITHNVLRRFAQLEDLGP